MNKLNKKTLKPQFLAIAALFAMNCLQAQKIDFSGNYTRNTEKCDAGGLSINSVPVEISVKQIAGQIQIRRISKNYLGDTTAYTEQVKFDGTPASSVIKPNLNKKSTIQWAADHKGFTENADYTDDLGNPKQNAKEIWFFDGKALKVQLTLTFDDQEYGVTETFDKR